MGEQAIARHRYPISPIEEAVCELRLPEDASWDATIPGLLYERFRAEYPKKSGQMLQQVGFQVTDQGAMPQLHFEDRMSFESADGAHALQVGLRSLSVIARKPYGGWEDFSRRISAGFSALAECVNYSRIQRIGLRYVNRLGSPLTPGTLVNFEDYFEFYPHLGPRLPQTIADFALSCSLEHASGRDRGRLQLASALPEGGEAVSFLLDIDYFLARVGTLLPAEVPAWVENAHLEVGALFEGMITDQLRTLFRAGSSGSRGS